MQINFSGHHVEVTPALKLFTQEKMEKLERHFDKINSIHVLFTIEKLMHIAEGTVLITKGKITARAEAMDMYTAIDDLIEKLDHQLIKHKEKLQDHRDHRDHRDQEE